MKSKLPRIVIRKSLKNMVLQIVQSKEAQDKVIITTHSKELRKFGWNGSLSNISASYLTGLLMGKKAFKKDIKETIADLGLQKSIRKTRIYAAIKGCIDSGLKINHDKKMFPEDERINGKHINKEQEFQKVMERINKDD